MVQLFVESVWGLRVLKATHPVSRGGEKAMLKKNRRSGTPIIAGQGPGTLYLIVYIMVLC